MVAALANRREPRRRGFERLPGDAGELAGTCGGGRGRRGPGRRGTGLPQRAPQEEKERPGYDPGSAPAAWTKAGETELHHVVEC